MEKIVKHDSWPIQPDILSPPLLRLTSRKPLWLDFQLVDIKSRWRRSWKSAQVVNSHLVCDPTVRQLGFDLPRQQWSLLNRFRTEQGHCGACRRKWRLTLICVLVARLGQCLTLSNPVPWQNWIAAYLGYTLWMKTLFCGWPIMVDDTHTRRRRLLDGTIGIGNDSFPDPEVEWTHLLTVAVRGQVFLHTTMNSDHDWHYWTVTYSIKIWPAVLDLEI